MKTIAQTTNGPVSDYFWLNNKVEGTSKLIHAGHLAEVLGLTSYEVDQYENIESLNDAIYDGEFSISNEAEYTNQY